MKARSVAHGGMMTGVSMLLLGLGTLFEAVSGAAALFAALVPALFFLRDDARTGRLVYGATSLLAVLLLPDKFTALVYAGVMGLYTVLKFWAVRRSRGVQLVCGALLVVFWVGASVAVIRLGLVVEIKEASPFVLLCLSGGWTAFLLYYDFCMTRIFAGMRRWLSRFR